MNPYFDELIAMGEILSSLLMDNDVSEERKAAYELCLQLVDNALEQEMGMVN